MKNQISMRHKAASYVSLVALLFNLIPFHALPARAAAVDLGDPAAHAHHPPRPELITRRSAVTPTGENPQAIIPAWFNPPTLTPIDETTTAGLALATPRALASVPAAAPRPPATDVLPHWFETKSQPDNDEPLAISPSPTALLPGWFNTPSQTPASESVNPESEIVNPLPDWFASPPLRPLLDCTPSADLDLQLSVPDPANVGNPQGDDYLIQVTNNSAVSATTDVRFEIQPSAGFFYAGNSAGGFSTGDGLLSFTSVATTTPGVSFNLTLTGNAAQRSLAPGEIMFVSFRMLANASAVSGAALNVALRSLSPTAQCDVVTENVSVVRGNVAFSKVPTNPTAGRGDTVQWALLVSNTGTGPVYDAALSDTVSTAFISPTFTPPITPLFTLSPGEVRSFLVEATLNAPTESNGEPPDNFASVLWPETNISGYAPYLEYISATSQIDYVVPPACAPSKDLRMSLIPPPNPVNRGDAVGEVYTVTIHNTSNTANSQEVSLLVDPNTGFYFIGGDAGIVSSVDGVIAAIPPFFDTAPGQPFSITIAGGVDAATLAPGEIMTFTFRLAANKDAQSGQLLETALLSGYPTPGVCKTAQQNIPTVRGNLVIIKNPSVQVAEVGDTVSWTVILRNTGLGTVYDAQFVDTIGSGYTNTVIPVSVPVDILPEDEVTYTVSGVINACGNLTNTVAAWWSIGNADGTGVFTTPVEDQVDVILELIDPNIDIEIGPLPETGYCDSLDAVIPITVTNNGGPGRNLRIENLSSGGLNISLETAPDWAANGNFFDYVPDIFPSNSIVTFTVRVRRADVCADTPVALSFRPRHNDACNLLQVIDDASTVTATFGTDAPTLDIDKSGPLVIVAGGEYTYTIHVSGDNRENIGPAGLFITDTLPSQIEVLGIAATDGTPVQNGTQITWQPDVTDTGTGAYSETMTIRYRVPLTYDCGAGGEINNRVDALAATRCPQCASLLDSDNQVSYIEDPVVGAFTTTVSSLNIDVCAPPDDPFTVTSVLEASNGITWAGSVYYSEEVFDTFSIVSGSVKVIIDGIDRTADVTVTKGVSLTIAFDNIGIYSSSAIITVTFEVTADSGIVSVNSRVLDFIFTAFSYGGIADNACGLGGIAFAGDFVSVNRGDLSVSVSPDAIETCRPNNVTVRVTNDNPTYVANNLVVTLTVDSADIVTPAAATYGGEFAGNQPTSVISSVVGSVRVITFIFPAAFSLANEGTINLPLFRPCGENEPLRAGVEFADQCGVFYGSGGSGGSQTLSGDVTLFVSPNEYKVPDREAQYQFYLSNNGDTSAVNLVVTSSLPLGYLYDSFSVSGNSQVSPGELSAISVVTAAVTGRTLITFNIPSLPVSGRLNFFVNVLADSCTDPAIVNVALPESCNQVDGSCGDRQDDQVKFTKGFPSLLSSNDQEANLKLCGTGPVNLVIKNTSAQASLYNYSITEILTNVIMLTNTAVVTVTDGKGNILTGTTSGQLLAGIPFTPATTFSTFGGDSQETLYWSLTNTSFISGTPQYDVLAKRRASEIIRINFLVESGCEGLEALVASEGRAEDICGVVLGFAEDSISLIVDAPDIIVRKSGKLVSDTTFSDRVFANAGDEVVWRLDVENIGAEAANTLNVKDILPPSFAVDPVTGVSPPLTSITSTSGLTTLIWSFSDTNTPLQPGGIRLFYITGTFLGNTCASTQTNKVEVNFGCSADDAECLSAPVADAATLDTQPDLTLSSDADLSVCNGVITITIENDGPPAHNVIITDVLPSGYLWDGGTIFSSTAPSAFTQVGTNTLEWRWTGTNTLPTGESTLVFRVINDKTGGVCNAPATVQNRVLAQYDNTCGDAPFGADQTDTLDVQTPQLQVAKTPGQVNANVGEVIVWTLSITNVGPIPATDIAITDTADSGFSNISAGPGSGGEQPFTSTNVAAQTIITWAPNLTIPVGGSWQAQVTATVESAGIQRNQVDIKGACLEGCSYGAENYTAFVTLFSEFDKGPPVQTGTIGSLAAFTFTATLPDASALYEDLIITDTLPAGLGYIDSYLSYVYSGSISVISNTPTVTPGINNSGNVVWRLGNLSGSVRFSGTITTVVQNISDNREGTRRVNQMNVTYTDDGQGYGFTDSANVDIYEPVLHIGKGYVTAAGCGATLYSENFNSNSAAGWVTDGSGGVWAATSGLYQYSGGGGNRRAVYSSGVFTDFSYSAMLRSTDSNAHMGLLFRGQDFTNTYRLRWGGSGVPAPSGSNPDQRGLRLERIAGGFVLPIVSASAVRYNPGTWYHLEVRAVGNRLEVYIDGILRLSATDSSFASGGLGLYTNDNNLAQFDDLLVTRLGQAGCLAWAGDAVTYTLTISNQGTLPGYDLVVTDLLPDGLNLATYTLTSNDATTTPAFTFEPAIGAGGVITWGIDHLTPTVPFDPLAHTALTLTVVLTVSPDITANIVLPNQATLVYDNWLTDTNPTTISRAYSGGSHSAAIRTVGAVVPISKTVQFSPPPTVTPGSLVTYTLLVPGAPVSATLRNVVITDQLNAPRFYIESITASGDVSATTGFSRATGLITATFGRIPAYGQALVTVTTRVSYQYPSTTSFPVSGNVITNTFVMTHATAEAITRSNVVSMWVGEPELTLAKLTQSSTGSLANLDGTALLTYVLRLTNSGNSPAYTINITDVLPAGLSVTQIFDGGLLQAGGILSWTLDSLSNTAPANTTAVSYTAVVSRVAAGSVLTNSAALLYHSLTDTIPGVRPYTNTTSAAISTARIRTNKYVQRSSGLTDNLRIGDAVTYTVVMTLPPAMVIYWPQLVDALPPGFRLISTTTRGLTVTPSPNLAGGLLQPPPVTGTLGSGATQREVITWYLSSVTNTSQSAVGVISTVFAAQITGLTPDGSETPPRSQQLNSVAADNRVAVAWNITDTGSFSPALALTETSSATSTVGQPQLDIAKTSSPASGEIVAASQLVTYFLTITNSGRTPAYNVIVTDTLPVGINYLSSAILPATVPFTRHETLSATGAVSWEVGVIGGLDDPRWLGLGRVVTIGVLAQVDAAVGADLTLTNSAAISYYDSMPDGGTGPLSPTQRTYTAGSDSVYHLTVRPALNKSVVPSTATLGSVITYVIAVPEPSIAANLYNITVTDRLDSRLNLQAVDAPGATGLVIDGNAFTVTISLIPSNTQWFITVTAILSSALLAVNGDVITNQAVMTHRGDSTMSNRTAFTVTEPAPAVTKEVSITTDPRVALYTITVANTGTASLVDITLIDTPPQGVSVTNISGGGQFITARRLISWTIATIPVGGQTVLTYNGVLQTGEIYNGRRFTNTVVATGTSLGQTVPGVRPYTDTASAGIDWPLGRIGDYVWFDQNYDGIQNENPATYGISGVVVELFESTSGSRLATTTTSITGAYFFDNLPLGVTYTVRLAPENFAQTGVLSAYTPTRLNAGNLLSDSGASADAIFNGSGYAITTTMLARSRVPTEDLSLDYGFVPPMALGNRVWFDINDDSRLNSGEPGLGGVIVELYRDTNGDGRYTPGIDARQATTTTNAAGYYTFTGLLPSLYPTETYLVVITRANFIGAGVLVNHITSSVAYTSNNDIGRDNLNHGILTGTLGYGGFVASTVITLTATLAPHDGGRANYTIDFGFLRADLGDLPDSYGTVITSSGPRHVILPDGNPTLGAAVDAESDGQPATDARGDDDNSRYSGVADDEDGVRLDSPLVAGMVATFTVTGTNVAGAVLNVWIDWNGNGFFDAGERVFTATPLVAGPQALTVTVPAVGLSTTINTRWRYSTDIIGSGSPTGTALNGEVEDHQYLRRLPALEMAKVRLGASPVLAGDPVTFAVIITNTGGTVLATVPLTDTYDPSVLVFAGASPPVSSSEPFAGRVQWNNVGPVPIGNRVTVTVVFTALRAMTVTTNTAGTAAVDNLTQPTPPATDTATVSINPRTDLALSKVSRPRPLLPGAVITYSLVVTNLGPSPVTALTLTDNLPSPVPSPVHTWSEGSFVSSTGYWDGFNLAAGDRLVLTISGRLDPGFTGQLQNRAVVTPGGGTDDNGDNNVATDTNTVLTPGITVDKLVDVAPNVDLSVVAATVTYTLRITNSGQVTYTALRITDTLPAGFTYITGTSRGAGSPLSDPVVQPGGDLVWVVPTTTLPPGQHYDLTFAALISLSRGTTGTFRNTFTGTGIYAGGQRTDSDSVDVVVTDPRVAVTKTLVSAVAGVLTFSITIRNTGPSTLAQVPLIDDWIGPLAFLSATPPPDAVITGVNSGRTFWGDLTRQATPPFNQPGRDLAPGESFLVTVVFSVTAPELAIAFTNTAVVSDAEDIYANPANDATDQIARENQPTPVTLVYFRGVPQASGIRLGWETAAEIDNFGFRLRRSSTGVLSDAVEIAFVPAAGGKFSGATYAFTDTGVLSSATYTYWLVDVDTNLKETVHGPLTIEFTGGINVDDFSYYLPVILKED